MLNVNKIVFIILLSITNISFASDYAKEQRWADQIVDFIIDGEAEWLAIGKHKMLAIYTEASTDVAKGGAIIIHGLGAHPNWEDIVHPMRTQLPEHGWHTLSIQMPVLGNDVEYDQYAPLFGEVSPRIKAAIQNFKSKGIDNIVIVAHSIGTTMTAYYLASNNDQSVKAFVAVGMPGPNKDKRMNTLLSLEKINIPLLDIYGSKDLEVILDSVNQRSSAASHNKKYSQINVKDADHFFNNKNDELINEVSGWLKNQ